MTKSSTTAYTDPENEKKRLGLKKRIRLIFDSTNGQYTAREMAKLLEMDDIMPARKRMCELHADGYLKVISERKENGRDNSVYGIDRNPTIWNSRRKSKLNLLKQAIRSYAVNEKVILEEYERLLNYQNK